MQLKKLSDSHYVVINYEEIKEGDFILINVCIIRQCDYVDGYMVIDTTQGKHHVTVCKKITHSTEPLDVKITDDGIHLPDWSRVKPLSPRVIKSLVGEVDVEKKSEEKYPISMQPKARTLASGFYDVDVNYMERLAYKHGYNQCLEDNKHKRFTMQDLQNAWIMGYRSDTLDELHNHFEQPKDTWEVEFIDGQLKLK